MSPSTLPRCTFALACALAAGAAPAKDGDLDFGFGFFGKAFVAPPGGQFLGLYNAEIALQPTTGKILIAAPIISAAGGTDFGVMRINDDGSVDSGFGSSGIRIVPFDRNATPATDNDELAGLTVQPDGRILLVGIVAGDSSTQSDIGLVRLGVDGALDGSFGSGGKTTVPFNLGPSGSRNDAGIRVNLQTDGKILVIGQADTAVSHTAMAIARLDTAGARDSSFDLDGRVTASFGGDAALGYRIKQLADGKLLAVGGAYTVPGTMDADFALLMLNDNGSPDLTFGVGGKRTYAFNVGGDNSDIATDFVENPDGTLFVCGQVKANDPYNYDFGCERFLADGTPDPAFTPVLVIFDRGGDFGDTPLRVERDAQGRYLLAGYAERATYNYDYGVARLLPSGQLDPSFGIGGKQTFSSTVLFGTDYDNGAGGLAIQPDGKILIAGHYATKSTAPNIYSDYQFEIVRVIGDTIFDNSFELP